MRWYQKLRKRDYAEYIGFDEVLADSGAFYAGDDTHIAVVERPFSSFSYLLLFAILVGAGSLLFWRTAYLGTVEGESFAMRSVNNHLLREVYTADRGIIYDRKGRVIVSNSWVPQEERSIRVLAHPAAFSHVVGFVGAPSEKDLAKDKELRDYEALGRDGVEFMYDDILRGEVGERLKEVNAKGEVISSGFVDPPDAGGNIALTIDRELQMKSYTELEKIVKEQGFRGGAAIFFNANNGEILTMTSYPSFDAGLFSKGISHDEYQKLISDPRSPLFNRAIAGTYAPGSTVKPFYATAALHEHVIDPSRQILSTDALLIPNPYQPGTYTRFGEFRAQGLVDMRRALAVSSNIYFYTVGGGYGDIAGLGISRLTAWLQKFHIGDKTGIDLIGEKTGTIPDATKKAERHPEDPTWRLGDTYHSSIGQGDFAITPIQMAVGLSALANGKALVTPHVLDAVLSGPHTEVVARKGTELTLTPEHLQVVKEGMIMTTEIGTARLLGDLPFQIAAKSGSAEVGNKQRSHSWLIAYTADTPEPLGMVLFLEAGPRENNVGAGVLASRILQWVAEHGGVEKIMSRVPDPVETAVFKPVSTVSTTTVPAP